MSFSVATIVCRSLLLRRTSGFLTCLHEARKRHGLAIHAYVLMTNHVHLVAIPANAGSLPNTLQSVGRRYVQFFNRVYRRTGTLWEGRHRDAHRHRLTPLPKGEGHALSRR